VALGRRTLGGAIVAFASRLRFPALFALTLALLAFDLLVPDALPFVDEVMLGLAAVALSRWRRKEDPDSPPKAGSPDPGDRGGA
jgi:hypothetical protein